MRSIQPAISLLLAAATLALTSISLLSGCGISPTDSEAVEKPPVEVSIDQVDQRYNLGTKKADGQFVIIKFSVKNVSNQDVSITPREFAIEATGLKAEDSYVQPFEDFFAMHFGNTYGLNLQDKVITSATPLLIHPKISSERYVIFTLPDDALLEKYELLLKTYKLKVPLVSNTTVINDHRNEIAK